MSEGPRHTVNITENRRRCTKTENLSHRGSNFASNFPSRQAIRMLLIMFLKSKFIFFFELLKFYVVFTKNYGIIRNDIEGNVLFYRVVRDIPH